MYLNMSFACIWDPFQQWCYYCSLFLQMNIACNVMRSCVGLSTSVINPQKFLISLKQPNSSFDEAPHSLSQNQEILTALSHDNNTKQQQQLLEEKMPSTSSTSAIFDQESGPVKIICHDKQVRMMIVYCYYVMLNCVIATVKLNIKSFSINWILNYLPINK